MQKKEKIILNSESLLDFYQCPTIYYAKHRLGIKNDSYFSDRVRTVNSLISASSREVLMAYYQVKFKIEELSIFFFKVLEDKIIKTIPVEKRASLYEICNESFFGPEIEKLEAFLRSKNFFGAKEIQTEVLIEEEDFIFKETIEFLTQDDTLLILNSKVDTLSYKFRNSKLLGVVTAAEKNNIKIQKISCFPYYTRNQIEYINKPNKESQEYFIETLKLVSKNIKERSLYPRPQNLCYKCFYAEFCNNFRSG